MENVCNECYFFGKINQKSELVVMTEFHSLLRPTRPLARHVPAGGVCLSVQGDPGARVEAQCVTRYGDRARTRDAVTELHGGRRSWSKREGGGGWC